MKIIINTIIMILVLTGCTQVVTAPIKVTGAVVGATIDIVGATTRAVAGSNDKKEKED
jgi:uncharacterized protein YceK